MSKRYASYYPKRSAKRQRTSAGFIKKAVAQVKRGLNEGSIVIEHAEHVVDFQDSEDFDPTTYNINPGSFYPFKWLSRVASKYESYKFHNLEFFFRSTMADQTTTSVGALGTILLGWQPNVYDPDFDTKLDMENQSHTVSTRPSKNLRLRIPCTGNVLRRQFVEDGIALTPTQDKRIDYMGKVCFAVSGMTDTATYTIGELWVKYKVELFKPKERNEMFLTDNINLTNVTNARPLGDNFDAFDVNHSSLGVYTTDGHTLNFPEEIDRGMYLISWNLAMTAPHAVNIGAMTRTNFPSRNIWYTASHDILAPESGVAAQEHTYMTNGIAIQGAKIDFGTFTGIADVDSCTLTITQLFDMIRN